MRVFFVQRVVFCFLILGFVGQVFPQDANDVSSEQDTDETSTQEQATADNLQTLTDKKESSLSFCVSGGVLGMINADLLNSDPSPILPSLGVALRLQLTDNVAFFPTVNFYLTRYLWTQERALPASLENRTALTPAMFIDMPFIYRFLFTNASVDLGGGIAICARAAFAESALPDNEKSSIDKINSYLWSSARFFYPSLYFGGSFKLSNEAETGISIRSFIPVFNLWTEPSVPLYDSLTISLSIFLRIF